MVVDGVAAKDGTMGRWECGSRLVPKAEIGILWWGKLGSAMKLGEAQRLERVSDDTENTMLGMQSICNSVTGIRLTGCE